MKLSDEVVARTEIELDLIKKLTESVGQLSKVVQRLNDRMLILELNIINLKDE